MQNAYLGAQQRCARLKRLHNALNQYVCNLSRVKAATSTSRTLHVGPVAQDRTRPHVRAVFPATIPAPQLLHQVSPPRVHNIAFAAWVRRAPACRAVPSIVIRIHNITIYRNSNSSTSQAQPSPHAHLPLTSTCQHCSSCGCDCAT